MSSQSQEHEISSLDNLPDELILHILNKVHDLKSLCRISAVSRRISALVPSVSAVSFAVPRLPPPPPPPKPSVFTTLFSKPLHFLRKLLSFHCKEAAVQQQEKERLPPVIASFYGDAFRGAVGFMTKIVGIKELKIELPSVGGDDEKCLFKWAVKFGHRIESFVFLSPTQLRNGDHGQAADEGEESRMVNDLKKQRVHLAFQCLKDVVVRHRMLMYFVKEYGKLESIAITDSNKQGRLFLSGEKLVELRDWIFAASGAQLKKVDLPVSANQWYVPVLPLPVSRYVMKGATLVLMEMVDRSGRDDMEVIGDDFEEDEVEAFGEAVVEMMVKHKSTMKTLL